MGNTNLTVTPAITMQQDRLRFPGMLPREILIFKNWLKLHEAEYDRFDYNFRIGAGSDPGPTWPDEIRRCAIMNTQLRLDAVAWKGNAPTIIEVKDRAGASAIGQLVTYEAVWIKDNPQGPAPQCILVTNRLQLNMGPVIQKAGLRCDVVECDFTSLKTSLTAPGYVKAPEA
jgi:hypothetical protein